MALIGTIRKNSWLLIIFIGMGLALFIITSMFVGNQIPFLDSQNTAGSIDGQEIQWSEFLNAEEALKGSGDIYAQRNAIWNFFIEDAIVQKQAKALGFSVSDVELQELQFGNNLSPIISARFTDPATRQVDRNQLNQIKNALESGDINPGYLQFWNHQKKEIIKEKLQSRMNTLVSKSIFTPTWMVEQNHSDQTQTASIEFVKIPFDEIDNADVTVTDSDLAAYLADNKKRYYQDEQTRKLDYIVFDVVATKDDTTAIRNEMSDLARNFQLSKDDTTFVDANAGTMDPRYISRDEVEKGRGGALTAGLIDAAFSANIGDVVGPIVEGNQMKIAKIVDSRVMPDSATSRHILINANSPQAFAAAEKTIDSLKNLLERGVANFDSLAVKFSQDPGSSAKGGLYENIAVNAFVPAYNDIIFFKGDIGKLYSVRSSYGVHLIEPISRKYADSDNKTERVKVSVISKTIVPSDITQESIAAVAQEFMANNRNLADFTQSANDQGLNIETTTPLKANDYALNILGTGATSRDIIRWAYTGKTSTGDVAPEVYEYQDPVEYYTSKYVVIGLKSITEAGNPSAASIADEIRPLVLNQKKAEVIKSRITSQNLSAIASSFSTKVDTAATVTFNSSFIPNMGNEPEVIATAFNQEPNSVSDPIIGNTGVYIVKLNSKSAVTGPSNIPTLRKQSTQSTQSQIAGSLLQSMKKNAEIKDLRSKFY